MDSSLQQLVLEAITLKQKNRPAPAEVSTPTVGTYNFYDFLMQSKLLPVDIKIASDDTDQLKKFAFIPSMWTVTDYNNGHIMLSKKNDPSNVITIIYGFQNWGDKYTNNPSVYASEGSPIKVFKNNLYISKTDPSKDIESIIPTDFKNSVIDIFELITKKAPKFAEELGSNCRATLAQKKFRTVKKSSDKSEKGIFVITGALKKFLVVLSDKKEVEIDSSSMDVLYNSEGDNSFAVVVSNNAPLVYENLYGERVTITANMDDKKQDIITINSAKVEEVQYQDAEVQDVGDKTVADFLTSYDPSVFKDFHISNNEQVILAKEIVKADYQVTNLSNENRVALTAKSPRDSKMLVFIACKNPVSFYLPPSNTIRIGDIHKASRVMMAWIPKNSVIKYYNMAEDEWLNIP